MKWLNSIDVMRFWIIKPTKPQFRGPRSQFVNSFSLFLFSFPLHLLYTHVWGIPSSFWCALDRFLRHFFRKLIPVYFYVDLKVLSVAVEWIVLNLSGLNISKKLENYFRSPCSAVEDFYNMYLFVPQKDWGLQHIGYSLNKFGYPWVQVTKTPVMPALNRSERASASHEKFEVWLSSALYLRRLSRISSLDCSRTLALQAQWNPDFSNLEGNVLKK